MPDPKRLSILIELRDAANLNQTEAAKLFGLKEQGRKSVAAWEAGESTPAKKRRTRFITYLWDNLGLRNDLEKFEQVFNVLVEEWQWEPLTDREWHKLTSKNRPHRVHAVAELSHIEIPLEIPAPEKIPELRAKQFVGRSEELAIYSHELKERGYVFIGGLTGVGKTEIAAELARQAAIKKVYWHTCYQEHSVKSIRWSLAEFFAYHGEPAVWQILKGENTDVPPDQVLDFLLQLMRKEPILICIDDLHLIGEPEEYREFIEKTVKAIVGTQIRLIVATQHQIDFLDTEPILLRGLNLEDTQCMLQSEGLADFPNDLLEPLHQRTEGNAQLLMVAINALSSGQTKPAALIKRLVRIRDVGRFLLKEIDENLSNDERIVMDGVSVLMGYPGTQDVIDETLEAESTHRELATLANRYLLEEDLLEFIPRYKQHAIVRAYYYEQLKPEQLEQMHHRAGSYYENVEEDYFRAALHYSFANDHESTARVAAINVWENINRGYTKVLSEILDKVDTTKLGDQSLLEVLTARGQVHSVLRNGDKAHSAYEEALDFLNGKPDSVQIRLSKAHIYHQQGDLLQYCNAEKAQKVLQAGIDLLQDSSVPEQAFLHALAELYIKLSSAQLAEQKWQEAKGSINHARNILDTESTPLGISAYINLGTIDYFQGKLDSCIAFTEKALTISSALQDPDKLRDTTARSNLAAFKFVNDQWAEAIEEMEKALRLANEIGSAVQTTLLTLNMGTAYIHIGDLELAQSHLEESLKMAEQYSLSEHMAITYCSLAELALKRGDADSALQNLAAAETLQNERAAAEGDWVELLYLRAEAKLHNGRLEEALADATRSVEIAIELEMDTEAGRGQRIAGQALYHLGMPAEGDVAFEKSVEHLSKFGQFQAAVTRLVWGRALCSLERNDRGKTLLTEAKDVFTSLKAQFELNTLSKIDSKR